MELSSAAGAVPIGLDINGDNSTVAGLIINGFGVGVRVKGAENTVRGCFIGTNATATEARPNTTGALVEGGNRNVIGGITTASRNVISGNNGAGVRVTGDKHRQPNPGKPDRHTGRWSPGARQPFSGVEVTAIATSSDHCSTSRPARTSSPTTR